jgi:hypothetical protein
MRALAPETLERYDKDRRGAVSRSACMYSYNIRAVRDMK